MITVLFLYRPIAWCFLREMRQTIDSKKLTERKGITYRRNMMLFTQGEPFTGTAITYGLLKRVTEKIPYVNGKKHGTEISYYADGSKLSEITYVVGERHGTSIMYRGDGSVEKETVWENGKKISEKFF